ncbi:ABC transporter permease [Fodinisporobacter ferrooxydans]|uniref:ABC transporter permease n=1 Tax=Fodinisporobacter ferrooxydans TaxID=2901836 RepID=A0ABY4CJH2_9BACL|nr:ABC transporter permease [Alicyclobacillaceae bacterium MYW30-H2]
MNNIAAQSPSRQGAVIIDWIQHQGVYIAFGLLLLINLIFTPHFASMNSLITQVIEVVPVLIVSLGMALVIGTEGIDLSVGAIMGLTSAVVSMSIGLGWLTAILISLVVGALCGLFSGAVIAFTGVQPIIVTLGLLVGLRGLGQMLVGGQQVKITNMIFLGLGQHKVLGVPEQTFIAVFCIAIIWFLLKRTTFGKYVIAIGSNRKASFLVGYPIRSTLLLVYIISGVLSACAGVIETARVSFSDPSNIGLLMELNAITAVVVGGTPLTGGRIRLLGTIIGALIMQLLDSTFIMNNLPNTWAEIMEAIIILLAVYIQRGRGSN